MKDNNIEIQYVDVGDHHKLGIADRVCRPLRALINNYLAMNKTTKYIDVLPSLVDNYNNTYHSTIKTTPNLASKKHDLLLNRINQYNKAVEKVQQFKIGDQVRYIVNKNLFEKGSNAKWSKATHKIVKQNEHSYELDN